LLRGISDRSGSELESFGSSALKAGRKNPPETPIKEMIMSKFDLSALLAVGLLVGPASTIAKAFEKLAKAVDQQKNRIWPDGYWTWLQQSAGG
jgi:hypothetical protein